MNLFIPLMYDISFISIGENIALSFISSTGTLILGLIVGGVAQNKVEGMAWFKICGFIAMLPIISIMVTSEWTYAFGIMFTFWPIKIIYTLAIGNPDSIIGLWIGAIIVHIFYIIIAFFIFKRKIFQ